MNWVTAGAGAYIELSQKKILISAMCTDSLCCKSPPAP